MHGFGIKPPHSTNRISINDEDAVEPKEKKRKVSDLEKSECESIEEEHEDEEGNDSGSAISSEELESALRISCLSAEQVCALGGKDGGWKLIHRVGDSFCLYKRRLQLSEDGGFIRQ